MALALLELLDQDDGQLRFRIDTGSNPFYQLKVGTQIQREAGIDLLESVYFATPVARSQTAGDPFDSACEIVLVSSPLDQRNSYAQLFTFKNASGRSPAFSKPLRLALSPVEVGPAVPQRRVRRARTARMMQLSTARRVPHRGAALARQASLDDLLGAILRIAAPIVGGLLGQGGPQAPAAANGAFDPASLIGLLLRSLAGPAAPAVPATAHASSLSVHENRFTKQMIFGIDDALLGAAIGQVVQVLPALANAANQRRIALKQADNNLTAGILSDINRRLIMDRLAELMRPGAPNTQVSPEQAGQLLALLGQLPSAPASPPAAVEAPAPAQTQSLGFMQSVPVPQRLPTSRASFALSNRAGLAFELGPAQTWSGRQMPLFLRGQSVTLAVRFNVGEPAPKRALPKVILKLVLKDSGNAEIHVEKVYKLKNVFAGQLLECPFEPGELAQLPANRPISAIAQLRWRSARGAESVALGSTEVVLVNKYHLADRGRDLGEELELSDMQTYRPFWNKVWEAPVLDGRADENGRKKYMWELDVALRYSVLLSATQTSNGLMETKLAQTAPSDDSLSEKVQGRMKSGIELGLSELNKLLANWKGRAPLAGDQLDAFAADDFVRGAASEIIHSIRLKGKDRERGLVWVVPVLKLHAFELATSAATDSRGQVTQLGRETAAFPLPWALRVLGMLSTDATPEADDDNSAAAADYAFPGYEVALNEQIVLTAPSPGGV